MRLRPSKPCGAAPFRLWDLSSQSSASSILPPNTRSPHAPAPASALSLGCAESPPATCCPWRGLGPPWLGRPIQWAYNHPRSLPVLETRLAASSPGEGVKETLGHTATRGPHEHLLKLIDLMWASAKLSFKPEGIWTEMRRAL